MGLQHYSHVILDTVEKLSERASYEGLCHQNKDGRPFPAEDKLEEIIAICRSILFPGFFGKSILHKQTIPFHIGIQTERLFELLSHQIMAGICFCADEKNCQEQESNSYHIRQQIQEDAWAKTAELIAFLPTLRYILAEDVQAAYNNDPAAESIAEIIFSYPGIRAISNHRIAHKLLELNVPIIPRMISEMAHSETGIDIHPGAQIGPGFTIDHGTGVVIGATSIIGNNVTIYQGVTLGAKNFPLDEAGNPIKGIPRHPILENNVVIYANATILGRITIGEGSSIGGNIWVTESVPPNSRVAQRSPKK